MHVSAVDLFCGAGGLTHGLLKEGIKVCAGIDIDPSCRYPYEKNNRAAFIQKDLTTVSSRLVRQLLAGSKYTVLAGCAPCTPFSLYTQGINTRTKDEWALLREFLRIAHRTKPDVITMENVPQLKKHAIYDDFVSGLRRAGYHVTAYEVDCNKIGVPQMRRRLVVFGSRFGRIDLVRFPRRLQTRTVREAIGHLPALDAGETCARDRIHRASRLSPLNARRIKASTPGSSWKTWPRSLVVACHRKEKGKGYPSIYGRMEWDKPAPTITTQFYNFGSGRFGHPEQDRAISPREAAILQSFPRNYVFAAPNQTVSVRTIGRLIGNAVPVRLGQLIGRSILRHLEEQDAN